MTTYRNPVWEGADPFVFLHEGTYYFYVSNGDEGYRVLTSDDLVNWQDHGPCLSREDVQGDRWFWAPEVTEQDGKFYMVYTAEEHIGIAVADSPLGPFKQATPRWLSERNAIDGSFFKDEDGQVYLYYVRFDGGNVIYGAKLHDMLTLDEEGEQRLIAAEAEWETRDCLVAEGPFMLKHNGKYYLTYSANHFRTPDYAVGYAVADTPLGPFKKYEGNPILKKNEGIVGTGHHCFTTSKDGKQLICVYHCHHNREEIHPRMTCIDPAEFTADGTLLIHGPTYDEQPSLV